MVRTRRRLVNRVWQHREFALGVILALLGALGLPSMRSCLEDRAARDRKEIGLVGSALVPSQGFFNFEGFVEVAYVWFLFCNYGNESVLLTSLEMEVMDGRGVQPKTYIHGRQPGVLGERTNENYPYELRSGQIAEICYRRGVYLPGVKDFLTTSDFDKQSYFAGIGHPTIVDQNWCDSLNREFTRLYGEKARLRVRLFTGFRNPVRTFEIALAEGQSSFEIEGRLMHDRFLGESLRLLDPSRELTLRSGPQTAP